MHTHTHARTHTHTHTHTHTNTCMHTRTQTNIGWMPVLCNLQCETWGECELLPSEILWPALVLPSILLVLLLSSALISPSFAPPPGQGQRKALTKQRDLRACAFHACDGRQDHLHHPEEKVSFSLQRQRAAAGPLPCFPLWISQGDEQVVMPSRKRGNRERERGLWGSNLFSLRSCT